MTSTRSGQERGEGQDGIDRPREQRVGVGDAVGAPAQRLDVPVPCTAAPSPHPSRPAAGLDWRSTPA
jgi:hypothetical protein